MTGNIKPHSEAVIGDESYTWEWADGQPWGDYMWETVDPTEMWDFEPGERIIQKRWRLVEVKELEPNPAEVADDDA